MPYRELVSLLLGFLANPVGKDQDCSHSFSCSCGPPTWEKNARTKLYSLFINFLLTPLNLSSKNFVAFLIQSIRFWSHGTDFNRICTNAIDHCVSSSFEGLATISSERQRRRGHSFETDNDHGMGWMESLKI